MMEGKILIVDDDPRNIFALSAVLKSRKLVCVSTTGASEALDLLVRDAEISVILLDMMMPDMDGYDAIPKVRKIQGHEKTPIVAVTAQAMVGDREKCLEAGADDYISKPVDVDKLMLILKRFGS